LLMPLPRLEHIVRGAPDGLSRRVACVRAGAEICKAGICRSLNESPSLSEMLRVRRSERSPHV
jgi:hypothetical protein